MVKQHGSAAAILALSICNTARVDGALSAVGVFAKGSLVRAIDEEAEMHPTLISEPSPSTVATNTSSTSAPHFGSHSGWSHIGRRAVGLTLVFVNMCLSSIGFVMQRKAHLLHARSPYAPNSISGGPQKLWIAGVCIYAMAALPDVAAYTKLPQMLCSTVGCFRIVLIAVLSHVFLEEKVKTREIQGIVICTIGALLCIRFGPGSDEVPDYPGELHSRKVMRYVCTGTAFLLALLYVVHRSSFAASNKLWSCALPLTTSLAYGLEKVFNSELTYVPMPAFSKLLVDTEFVRLLSAIAFFGLLDFYLNMRAAKVMPLHQYIPLTFAFGTLIQNFQGLVVLDEIRDMQISHSVLTCLGAALALTGALTVQPIHFESHDAADARKHSKSSQDEKTALLHEEAS